MWQFRFGVFVFLVFVACFTPVIDAQAPTTAPTTLPSLPLNAVNIHFMLDSDCTPKSVASIPKELVIRPGTIQLIVKTDLVPFDEEFEGVTVFVINSTKKEAIFIACGDQLHLVQEALDIDGTWKAIEYYPTSFCGNAYCGVSLPADSCWKFAAPRYSGARATKLRFRLDPLQGQASIVSDEFDGSVNPDQFHEKENHQPRRLARHLN